MNVHNRGLALGFQGKDLKLDLFSQAEENLFIDLLVKADEEARGKASRMKDEIKERKFVFYGIPPDSSQISPNPQPFPTEGERESEENIFLSGKTPEALDLIQSFFDGKSIPDEQKRKYMELKFDFVESLQDQKSFEKSSELFQGLKQYFPLFGDIANLTFGQKEAKALFFPTLLPISHASNYKTFKSESLIKSIEHKDDLSKIGCMVFPILIPLFDSQSGIVWTLKELDFRKNFNFEAFSQREDYQQSNYLSYLNSFLLFRDDPTPYLDDLIAEVFPKTNIFCDYRWIETRMLE